MKKREILAFIAAFAFCLVINNATVSYAEKIYPWPIATNYSITRGFSSGHSGVDMACPEGVPIYAPCDGTLSYYYCSNDGGKTLTSYGNLAEIDNGTYVIKFCHLSSFAYNVSTPLGNAQTGIKGGDSYLIQGNIQVSAGTLIGYTGHSGNTRGVTGDHLHLEIVSGGRNGTRLNPNDWFDQTRYAGNIIPPNPDPGPTPPSGNEGEEMTTGFGRVLADGNYIIVSANHPTYFLDISGGGAAANNTNVQLWGDFTGAPDPADVWTVTYNGTFYNIQQMGVNEYLDVSNASKAEGANLQIYTRNPGYPAQDWAIKSLSGDTYAIYSKCSGFVVDVDNGEFTNGRNVRQWTWNDTDAQKWKFIPYQYTVSYDANNGSGAPAAQTKTYRTALTLSPTVPTRSGYTFLGWSTSSTAASATYKAGGSYTTDANVKLYAVWQAATPEAIYTYTVTDGEATITGYKGSGGNITLPVKLGGYPVTTVDQRAFFNISTITGLAIPEGYKILKSNAFAYCSNLTQVKLPTTLTLIDAFAFRNTNIASVTIPINAQVSRNPFTCCSSLVKIDVATGSEYCISENGALFTKDHKTLIAYPTGLKYVSYTNLPAMIEAIGKDSIRCESLEEIWLPYGTKIIGEQSFYGATKLKKIVIPETVESIESNAFYGCTNLTIYAPKGSYAYQYASENKISVVDYSEYEYSIDNGTAIITKNTGVCWYIILPTELGGYPVTAVGPDAFFNNQYLKSVIVPEGYLTIMSSAFSYCTNLRQIDLPDSLLGLNSNAFRQDPLLTEITIPAKTELWRNPFTDCDGLTNIILDEQAKNLMKISNALYSADGTYLFSYPAGLNETVFNVPDGTKTIGYNSLRSTQFTEITLPASVQTIEDYALVNCSNLKKIVIPQTVSSIGENTFYNCGNVTIYAPANSYAESFAKANNIPVVNIAASVDCGSALTWAYANGVLTLSGAGDMWDYAAGYAPWAMHAESITQIQLPSELTGIGANAFANCSHVKSIELSQSIISIGEGAFEGCNELLIICHAGSAAHLYAQEQGLAWQLIAPAPDCILPSALKEIEERAFENTPFVYVRLSEGVTTIADFAFYNCKNLVHIYIPDSTERIAKNAFEGVSDHLVIHGKADSYAEFFAFKNGYTFVEE